MASLLLQHRPPLAPVRSLNHSAVKRPRSPEKLPLSAAKRSKSQPESPSNLVNYDTDHKKLLRKQQRKQDEADFRASYRKHFPEYVFFFNTSDTIRDNFLQRIQELGARHEPFFSSKVTHVITAHRYPTTTTTSYSYNNKENAPSKQPTPALLKSPLKLTTSLKKTDDDLLAKAKQFEMKIWDVEKFDSILDRITLLPPSPKQPRPTTLQEMMEAERRTGVTTERDSSTRRPDFEYFPRNSCYVLIEDTEGYYATVALQEYDTTRGKAGGNEVIGSWPTLYLNPLSHSPFIDYDSKEAKRRRQLLEDEKARKHEKKMLALKRKRAKADRDERIRRKGSGLRRTVSMVDVGRHANARGNDVDGDDEDADLASGFHQTGYLAASGNSVAVISGTGTTSTTGMLPRSLHSSLTLRKQIANQVVVPRNLGDTQPALRKSKSTTTMRLPKREEGLKPGFCESCRIKFQDFQEHISGRKHSRFAANDANFVMLDCLLARLKRRTLRELEEQRAAEDANHGSLLYRELAIENNSLGEPRLLDS